MRLKDDVIDAVKKAGVEVWYADRRCTRIWNDNRSSTDELMCYGGWYWMQSNQQVVVMTDQDGPFKTQMAAVRDAYVKLQLRHNRTKKQNNNKKLRLVA